MVTLNGTSDRATVPLGPPGTADRPKSMTAPEIIKAVENHLNKTTQLRERMEEDFNLFALQPFKDTDPEGFPLDGYYNFTSSDPQIIAQRVIDWISGSQRTVRINADDKDRDQREVDNTKERWIQGILSTIDNTLTRRMEPKLIRQLAWQAVLRGRCATRAVLEKREDFTTRIDVIPWDPLNTYWQIGKDGLEWACLKISKTVAEIKSDYGVDLVESGDFIRDDDSLDIYDFYDKFTNSVVAQNETTLKESTPHGTNGMVPVAITIVGSMPVIQSKNTEASEALRGESIYAAMRDVIWWNNKILSVRLNDLEVSRTPPFIAKSRDGSKLPDDSPFKPGKATALETDESIEPLQKPPMNKDSDILAAEVSGLMQRAGIPHSAFGQLNFQLSGFAINSLEGGIDTLVETRMEAVDNNFNQIIEILTQQYTTSDFPAMTLSGQDNAGKLFKDEMVPSVIAEGGMPVVMHTPVLPEDDIAKANHAQLMRQPDASGTPLAPDRHIHDKILKIQDIDNFQEQIRSQMARRGVPEALMLSSMLSAEDQGEPEFAQLYLMKLQSIVVQQMLQLSQLGVPVDPSKVPGLAGIASQNGPTAPLANPGQGGLPAEAFGINEPPAPETVAGGQQGGGEPTLDSLGLFGPGG
jgi:hypothetical protein